MSQRGQVAIGAIGGLTAVLLGVVVLLHLARIAASGAGAQTAADVAALAAARALADDPSTTPAAARSAAASAAHANGARLTQLVVERTGNVATGVEVTVASAVAGTLPVVGADRRSVVQRARAAITYTAALPGGAFRPVDLHGARGVLAAVAAAEAQVGWPYVWGGESRAEGGFDCSGLIDYAYGAAGLALPGRPTAADLWRMAAPEPSGALLAGDLVFAGATSGAPHHVGMYVGGGTVVVAPHTGAQVRYEPVAAGGWDGYGRIAGPPARGVQPDPAVERAARRHQVPTHVLAAELDLGLAADAEAAAAGLAAAQRRHPGDLQAALADALGDASLAAAVLRLGSGSGLPAAGGAVRLLPVADSPAAGPASPLRAEPVLRLPSRGGGGGPGWIAARLNEVVTGAQHVADHLEETGGKVGFQGAAGLRTLFRAGLLAFASMLPEEWERDLSSAAGSTWDAAEAVAGAAEGGMPLGAFGIWAARFTLAGTLIFAASSFLAARRARSRDDWVFAVAQGTGYGLNAAGLATAGSGLLTAGAATAEIPPIGLGLLAAGSLILVASYGYRYRGAIDGALDAAGNAARSALHAAFDTLDPF
ncbi:MAG TPA: C40 family peptidase [Gaiellales bacterium]